MNSDLELKIKTINKQNKNIKIKSNSFETTTITKNNK
jgi:hypothetical protein